MSNTKNLLEVVRIRDGRSERNATRAEAKRIGAEVIDKPTRDRYDRPVPAKPLTDLAGQPVDQGPTAVSEKLTHDELDAVAAERGVDLTGATTKADKVAAITTKEN
ncbi:hypothetical protein [Janibacter sp. LM]|uniref:hypothetical protein n=1 Tax=Janibacter sp. LM TaxID=3144845 RepID=UPI0031F673E5